MKLSVVSKCLSTVTCASAAFAVTIMGPIETTLVEGEEYLLTGIGSGMSWSYDANSDGEGEIAIGDGAEVSFVIPSGISSPGEITLILTGDDGKDEKTYDVSTSSTPSDTSDDPRIAPEIDAGIWIEEDGMVVIECEDTDSDYDKWVLHTDNSVHDFVDGFTGDGCLQFTGNQEKSGGVNSILSYKILITNPGTYRLYMHGLEAPLETGEGDKANDCYLAMLGQDGCEGTLKKFVRLGSSYVWTWKIRLECSHHSFSDPVYQLDAGVHELQIAGRSKNFFIDRVVIAKESISGDDAKSTSLPQSSRTDLSTARYNRTPRHNWTDRFLIGSDSRFLYGVNGRRLGIVPTAVGIQKSFPRGIYMVAPKGARGGGKTFLELQTEK